MELFDSIFLKTWRPYAWIVLVGFLLYFKAIFFGYTYLKKFGEATFYVKELQKRGIEVPEELLKALNLR
jgi:hypothetical protein